MKRWCIGEYWFQEETDFTEKDYTFNLGFYSSKEEAFEKITSLKDSILEDRELSEDDVNIEKFDDEIIMTYKVEDSGLEIWHWKIFDLQEEIEAE